MLLVLFLVFLLLSEHGFAWKKAVVWNISWLNIFFLISNFKSELIDSGWGREWSYDIAPGETINEINHINHKQMNTNIEHEHLACSMYSPKFHRNTIEFWKIVHFTSSKWIKIPLIVVHCVNVVEQCTWSMARKNRKDSIFFLQHIFSKTWDQTVKLNRLEWKNREITEENLSE